MLMSGGGHLEFSHEKVDEKDGNSFLQSFRVNISEKSQIFQIYLKSHRMIQGHTLYVLRYLVLAECQELCTAKGYFKSRCRSQQFYVDCHNMIPTLKQCSKNELFFKSTERCGELVIR